MTSGFTQLRICCVSAVSFIDQSKVPFGNITPTQLPTASSSSASISQSFGPVSPGSCQPLCSSLSGTTQWYRAASDLLVSSSDFVRLSSNSSSDQRAVDFTSALDLSAPLSLQLFATGFQTSSYVSSLHPFGSTCFTSCIIKAACPPKHFFQRLVYFFNYFQWEHCMSRVLSVFFTLSTWAFFSLHRELKNVQLWVKRSTQDCRFLGS